MASIPVIAFRYQPAVFLETGESVPLAARRLRGAAFLAGAINARGTAEGVETAEQALFLMASGVEHGRGWCRRKALPIESFVGALGRGPARRRAHGGREELYPVSMGRPRVPDIASHGFVYLFVSLIVMNLAAPIASLAARETGVELFLLINEIAFFGVLIAAVTVLNERGPLLALTLVYAIGVGAVRVVGFFFGAGEILTAGEMLAAVFLTIVILSVLRTLFRPQVVSVNTIAASLSAYLLIAVWFALIFMALERTMPGSFVDLDGRSILGDDMGDVTALYFSYVTITTLGYGDIMPVTGPARMLSVMEALLGQVYLVVLVARLVGLHIASGSSTNQTTSA